MGDEEPVQKEEVGDEVEDGNANVTFPLDNLEGVVGYMDTVEGIQMVIAKHRKKRNQKEIFGLKGNRLGLTVCIKLLLALLLN